MTPTDTDITEHLMRLLPTNEAEPIYLQSRSSSWCLAIGLNAHLLPELPDGTPMSAVITGRRARADWRTLVPAEPGSSWEELTLLRLSCEEITCQNPFDEIDTKRLAVECAGLAYRD